MRGVVAKRLRKAARGMFPPDTLWRMPLSVLSNTIRVVKKTAKRSEGADADIEATFKTATYINSPETPYGRYRLLKRAYTEARYSRYARRTEAKEADRRRTGLPASSGEAYGFAF